MVYKRMVSITALLTGLILGGCGDDPVHPITQVEGNWGAEHIDLVAVGDGALLEHDCAHGTIDGALVLDSNGEFDLVGTHVREGGPVDENDPPEILVARYHGRVRGNSLVLTVTLTDSGIVIGPYVLAKGEPGLIRKCL
jgi:hypothetical protein